MSQPRTVLQAIKERLSNTTEVNSAVAGAIWLSVAPERTELPLILIDQSDEVPEWKHGSSYREYGTLTIRVVAKTAEQADDIARDIKDSVDWSDLLINNVVRSVSVKRVNYSVGVSAENRSPEGTLIFEAVIVYETIVERTRGTSLG